MNQKVPKKRVKVMDRPDDTLKENPEPDWQVILFNDNINYYGDVITAVMQGCKTSKGGAEIIVHKAHTNGKASCYLGTRDDCEKVVSVLSTWKLTTSIEKI